MFSTHPFAPAASDRHVDAARIGAAGAITVVLAGAAHWLPQDVASWAALRVVLGACAVGWVPGALLLLALRSRRSVVELELFALAPIATFLVVQVLCIGALVAHWSAVQSLLMLGAIALVSAIVAIRRQATVAVSTPRAVIVTAILLVAAILYVQGAPYSSSEDQIHVALARRLAFWASPNQEQLYFLYNVPTGFYPYPFPATHYFIALISRACDLDVIFVYHKLRMFWATGALALVYVGAATAFGHRLAVVTTATAITFVLNGTFSNSHNFFWAQLTPFSHASDVALGLLLPALIVLTMRYTADSTARDRWVHGSMALALTASLCIVHPREVVQQMVYLLAMSLILLVERDQPRFRRAVGLLVVSVATALAYQRWHSETSVFVNTIIDRQRDALLNDVRRAGWYDLLIGTPSINAPGAQLMFVGWNALALFLSPLLLWAFRRRPLVRFIAWSIFIYLLIVRVRAFAIPYILGSYFEITTSGMRNVIFFIHMTFGVSLWIVARLLVRLPMAARVVAGGAIVGVFAVICNDAQLWLFGHQDVFFLPLIAAWAIVIWWEARQQDVAPPTAMPGSVTWTWAAMTAALAVLTFIPGEVAASNAARMGSALTASYHDSVKTPTEMFAMMGDCVDLPSKALPFQPPAESPIMSGPYKACPPSPAFLAFARQHVPVNAVVAASKFNPYPMSVFLPVRMLAWPALELTYYEETVALRDYYQEWDRALARYRTQPFFNTVESPAERRAFLDHLGVTHVVVDPNYRSTLKPILDAAPDLVTARFDDGGWTVYEVKAAQ